MKRLLPFVFFLLIISFSTKAQPPIKPHFNHQTVYVTDLARSTAFYKDVMLLDTIAEPFHDNRHTWFKITEHGELHVVGGSKAVIPHDINIHLAFAVADLPGFMKHLDGLNVKYGNWAADDKKVQMRPDNISQIYLQDPDGYWIEVDNDRF